MTLLITGKLFLYWPGRSRCRHRVQQQSQNFLTQNVPVYEQGIYELYNTVSEKISHLDPSSAGFQFLVTFSDRTHYEHQEIAKVKDAITNNSKTTERLTLKWVVRYKFREKENELTVVLRIANPINPLLFLQAALSKAPNDFDNLEFERCPVSVSVSGASQILAEEIFVVVGKWIDSRPQPQYITSAHNKIADNQNAIAFFNYWLFPDFGDSHILLCALATYAARIADSSFVYCNSNQSISSQYCS